MARKKEAKEKDIIDQLLDNINFKGLTQNDVGRVHTSQNDRVIQAKKSSKPQTDMLL